MLSESDFEILEEVCKFTFLDFKFLFFSFDKREIGGEGVQGAMPGDMERSGDCFGKDFLISFRFESLMS